MTDLRWAARQLRRRPGIPLIIVLSLGSAMGTSSSLFSVVNAAWFKPPGHAVWTDTVGGNLGAFAMIHISGQAGDQYLIHSGLV